MKLTVFKRLFAEDYKEAPKEWFPKFVENMNNFMDPVVTALRNGLTFEDNMKCTIKQIKVQSDQEIEIGVPFSGLPSELIVSFVDDNVMYLGHAYRVVRPGVVGVTIKLSRTGSDVTVKLRIMQ